MEINQNLKMPHAGTLYYALYDVLSFGDVIFAFYFDYLQNYDIWYLDLLNDKWYKSKYKAPKLVRGENVHVFKRENDAFICCALKIDFIL